MARIAAGQDFGQAVAQPAQLERVQIPRSAFVSADGLDRAGQAQEQAAVRQIAEQERTRVEARETADRAMATAKLNALRDTLDDELQAVGRGVLDGTVPKDRAGTDWQERTTRLIDDGLRDVPEMHRETVRVDLQTRAQRYTSKVGDVVLQRDRQDTLAAIKQTDEHTQRLAATDPAKALEVWTATLQNIGPAAGLTPVQQQQMRQRWIETTSYTRAFSAVNAAKNDNKALAAVEQGLQANTDLDPQRKAQLLAQVEGYRGANDARALRAAPQAELAAPRRQRESSAAFNVLSGWALAGKAADPNANAAMIAKLTPEDAAAYKALAAEIPARTAAAMLPIDQQQGQLDQLYAMRAERGTSQRLEQEITRREQVLKQTVADYGAEPLRAAQERGILEEPLQPLRMDSAENLAAGLAVRVQQAQQASAVTRRPESPLLSTEADKFARFLGTLPAAQRSERIAQIAGLMPPEQAVALAGQLGKGDSTEDKRALAVAFALGASKTTEARFTSELVIKGAEALKAKTIKEEKTPVDGWMGQISKQVEGVFANPMQAKMAADAARLILAGLVAEGGSGSSGDAKKAVRLAVGGDLREHNGERLLLPAGLELSDLNSRMRSMTEADLAPQLPDGQVYIDGRAVSVDDFLARLPDAKLQYVSGDRWGARYLVRTEGGYAGNQQRRPIVLTVGAKP